MRKNQLILMTVMIILTSCSIPKINNYNTNGQKHGIWVELYDCNGSVKELTKYKKGIKTGRYCSFYEVGNIETKGRYRKNKEVGVWKLWNVDGVLLRKWVIRNDTVIRGRIRQPAKI